MRKRVLDTGRDRWTRAATGEEPLHRSGVRVRYRGDEEDLLQVVHVVEVDLTLGVAGREGQSTIAASWMRQNSYGTGFSGFADPGPSLQMLATASSRSLVGCRGLP